MALEIQLLGEPRVRRDGCAVPPPRGRKVWALLALLLCAPAPRSRAELAGQLFEDADDPLAALRWNLSELRRLLGTGPLARGPLALPLPPGTRVDVLELAQSPGQEALALPGLGRELLEGMNFDSLAAFSLWLDTERRRLAHCAEAALREGVLASLALGASAQAARQAARLVQLNPLDEGHQALLVRSLAAAGEGVAAARQVAACRDLFRRELGVEPGLVLAAAAATTTDQPVAAPLGGRAGAQAQLEAGEAAIRAGAHDAGIHCLRRAVTEADAAGDAPLRARARVALGSALIHAVRARDDEGAIVLHEALRICQGARCPAVAAEAARELGYVEFLRARYGRAMHWLAQAQAQAGGDAAQEAAIATLQAAVLSDTGRYEPARRRFAFALRSAAVAGAHRQRTYALAMLGRMHLLCGELDAAAGVLDRSVADSAAHWTAFLPWPEALRAEVALERGVVSEAAGQFEHALALASQLRDPCWECLAMRGLGRIAAARGDDARAAELYAEAIARGRRVPDGYVWARAYALEALCAAAVRARMPAARQWVTELRALASGTGMRDLLVRAHVHAAALGLPGSAAAARRMQAEAPPPAPVARRRAARPAGAARPPAPS